MNKETNKSSSTLERILLAAIHCYGLHGVEETTLEQVAEQAGVGRSTVYRHAKNRSQLLNKVLLRDADHALTELQVAMRYYHSLEEVVMESILFLMRRRNNYQMQHILYGNPDNTTPGSGLSLEVLCGLAASSLQPHFERAITESTAPPSLTLPMLADWVGRITQSLHSQASEFTATEDALRAYLKVVLAPIFYPQAH
ncbi:MAG: TetR/AcrR family transcriptional regulator [Halioglobus sp.]